MGRPCTFDMEDAVKRAMNLFWEKGYQAANLPDLLEAMGIVRGVTGSMQGDWPHD